MLFPVESQNGTEGRVHVDIFYCEQLFAPSSSLKDEHGNIHAGIEPFPLFFADVGNLREEDFLDSTANGFEGEGDHEEDDEELGEDGELDFEEDNEDDEDAMDNETDNDFQVDNDIDLEVVDESGRIGRPSKRISERFSKQTPQRRHTGRPCGHNLQPMQPSPRVASPEDDNRMEQPSQVRTQTESTSETGRNSNEDVEMRDDSESDEDEEMGEDLEISAQQAKDKAYYIVRAWVQLSGTADGLDSTMYLMRPEYRFGWERNDPGQQHRIIRTRGDMNEEDILSVHTGNSWSKWSSHRVSNTSNASGPRG